MSGPIRAPRVGMGAVRGAPASLAPFFFRGRVDGSIVHPSIAFPTSFQRGASCLVVPPFLLFAFVLVRPALLLPPGGPGDRWRCSGCGSGRWTSTPPSTSRSGACRCSSSPGSSAAASPGGTRSTPSPTPPRPRPPPSPSPMSSRAASASAASGAGRVIPRARRTRGLLLSSAFHLVALLWTGGWLLFSSVVLSCL
ncbi:hypothetical protein PAHAL_1G074600 [Panicum hallii]|uniref:Uncharacterized protein n=1 Tax=Panicum hallii TaxID=206008 RepID=A0A2S3GMD6_9POAL|nr:hypothetical protein PAHAL_1G074600 [Panicum hallii]